MLFTISTGRQSCIFPRKKLMPRHDTASEMTRHCTHRAIGSVVITPAFCPVNRGIAFFLRTRKGASTLYLDRNWRLFLVYMYVVPATRPPKPWRRRKAGI